MDYLKPLSLSVRFSTEIRGRNIQPFIDVIKGTLFEHFEIKYMRESQSCIDITLSTTIQSSDAKHVCFGMIDRYEKRFRKDYLNRISSFNDSVICIKETTEIKFLSKAYPLSRKSIKKTNQ